MRLTRALALPDCMGGLAISPAAEVVTAAGKPIPGLFAAGEVAGGIHGRNRLGGNSLLDCVVFGRVAGATAARALFRDTLARVRSTDGASRVTLAHTSAEVASASASVSLAPEQVAKHASEKDCWVILNGKVYDVTKARAGGGAARAAWLTSPRFPSSCPTTPAGRRPSCCTRGATRPRSSTCCTTRMCSPSICPPARASAPLGPPPSSRRFTAHSPIL